MKMENYGVNSDELKIIYEKLCKKEALSQTEEEKILSELRTSIIRYADVLSKECEEEKEIDYLHSYWGLMCKEYLNNRIEEIRAKNNKCYLIAKKPTEKGCISVKMEYGPKLSSLVDYLGRVKKDVEIFTVSSKEAHCEYKPYAEIEKEEDFITKVFDM